MSSGLFFALGILFFSIVVHEYSHGWMALRCGDPTAKLAGRLTLNPIPHIDPLGTVTLPLMLFVSGSPILFGWAKPVPVNPANFNNPEFDNVKVSGAGPLSNIIMAAGFTVLAIMSFNSFGNGLLYGICLFGININILLALINLIPIAPLDGSHILGYYIPSSMKSAYYTFQKFGSMILLTLFLSPFVLPRFGIDFNFLDFIFEPFYYITGLIEEIIKFFT